MNSRSPTVIVLDLAAVSGAIVGGMITAIVTLMAMSRF
jgi:hypothetical protein